MLYLSYLRFHCLNINVRLLCIYKHAERAKCILTCDTKTNKEV